MHETDDAPAREPSDEQQTDEQQTDEQRTNAVRRVGDSRLRTFRTGSDLPFLVLPDERRDDPSAGA